MKSYIHVYTGNGKGKTTASLGLCLRALGAGFKVMVIQFLKKGDYSEVKALEVFGDRVVLEQYGMGRFVKGKPSDEDLEAGKKGFERAKQVLGEGKFDLVVLDEANVAVTCGLFSEEELVDLMNSKADDVELVITGRGAGEKVINRADLVTEMLEVKHYYKNGVTARTGIEK